MIDYKPFSKKEAKSKFDQSLKESRLSRKEWYNSIYLKSAHWDSLRTAKLYHSKSTCEKCNSGHRVQIHHLKYKNFYDVTLEDLMILCQKCHFGLHDKENRRKNIFPLEAPGFTKGLFERFNDIVSIAPGKNKPTKRKWACKLLTENLRKERILTTDQEYALKHLWKKRKNWPWFKKTIRK